jgi:hypothetical protein
MASSPLSQTTEQVIKTINNAQEQFGNAQTMVNQIHEEQLSIVGTQWHGDSAVKYRHDSDSLNHNLSELIKTGLTYCDEALANVHQTANAANGV